MGIEKYFSPYLIGVILAVGLYSLCIQGPNLIKINHLNAEGRFLKITGGLYIAIGIIGILIRILE